ncbi:hypothetical protein [Thermostaphylospora chromogena]|nr:hypothetical protein [Thermostaphylospora chromogena]
MTIVGSSKIGRAAPSAQPEPEDPREWCVMAAKLLADDQPEAALAAADEAIKRDERIEWGHRLASLALERLGRDAEAVAAAERAVRLAPGSWAARLRLGSALRRTPGRWREAWTQAAKAVHFAPEEPDAHVLAGDLALARGEHDRAARSYRAALDGAPDHLVARINLSLALLRWERPRPHHDPAWVIDPRETGGARNAVETWARQVRLLFAVALPPVVAAGLLGGHRTQAAIAGLAVLALAAVPTLRQARRMRIWSYLPQILARDVWLTVKVALTPLSALAYTAAVLTLPVQTVPASARTGLLGFVVLNGAAVPVVRVLVEAWRGRPVLALAELTAALPERTARRNADIALWIVAARAWSLTVLAALVSPLIGGLATGPGRLAAALAVPAGIAVPAGLAWARRRTGLSGQLRRLMKADRSLALALALAITASAAIAVAGAAGALGGRAASSVAVWGWRAVPVALAGAAVVFVLRTVRARLSGLPGPWRESLVFCEGCGRRQPGDISPPVELSEEVRRAFTSSRGVVLAYADPSGPRAMAVGAVASIGPTGELCLIADDDAWQAAERDPRVSIFAADPIERRFWTEVCGTALGDAEAEVLRVTPKRVVIGEYPGPARGRR